MTEQDVIDSPHIFIGSIDRFVEKFCELRERLGIKSFLVGCSTSSGRSSSGSPGRRPGAGRGSPGSGRRPASFRPITRPGPAPAASGRDGAARHPRPRGASCLTSPPMILAQVRDESTV